MKFIQSKTFERLWNGIDQGSAHSICTTVPLSNSLDALRFGLDLCLTWFYYPLPFCNSPGYIGDVIWFTIVPSRVWLVQVCNQESQYQMGGNKWQTSRWLKIYYVCHNAWEWRHTDKAILELCRQALLLLLPSLSLISHLNMHALIQTSWHIARRHSRRKKKRPKVAATTYTNANICDEYCRIDSKKVPHLNGRSSTKMLVTVIKTV